VKEGPAQSGSGRATLPNAAVELYEFLPTRKGCGAGDQDTTVKDSQVMERCRAHALFHDVLRTTNPLSRTTTQIISSPRKIR